MRGGNFGGPEGGTPPTFPEIFVSPKVAYFSYLKSHKVSGLSEPPIKEHYVISRRGGRFIQKMYRNQINSRLY